MASYNRTLLTGQGMSFDDSQTAGLAYRQVWSEIVKAISEQREKDDGHSKEAIEALKSLKEEIKAISIANKDTRVKDLPPHVRGQFTDISRTIQQLTKELPSKKDWEDLKDDLGSRSKLEERFGKFERGFGKNTVGGTAAQVGAGAIFGPEAEFVVRAIQESTGAIKEVIGGVHTLQKAAIEGGKKTGEALSTLGSFFNPNNPQGITNKLISGISGILSGDSFLNSMLQGIAAIIPKFIPLRTGIPGADTALLVYDLIRKVQEKFPNSSFQLPALSMQTIIDLLNKITPGDSGAIGDPSLGPRSSLGGGASPVNFADAGGMRLLSGGFGGSQAQAVARGEQEDKWMQFLAWQEQQDIAYAGKPQLAAYHPSDNPYGDPTERLSFPGDQGIGIPTRPFRPRIPRGTMRVTPKALAPLLEGLDPSKFNPGFHPNVIPGKPIFKGLFQTGGLISPGGVGVVGENGAERVQATPSGAIVTPTPTIGPRAQTWEVPKAPRPRGKFESIAGDFRSGGSSPGSWFSQDPPVWVDPQDRPNSGRVPDPRQGIGLPHLSSMYNWYVVTAPSGKSAVLQQTDLGPGRITQQGIDPAGAHGRLIDISAAGAQKLGYARPKDFPTDKQFTWAEMEGPNISEKYKDRVTGEYRPEKVPSDLQPTAVAGPGGATAGRPAQAPVTSALEDGGLPASSLLAPSGKAPEAVITHYTEGHPTAASMVADWQAHRPGVGSEFFQDREGNIHDLRTEFPKFHGTAHIHEGKRRKEFEWMKNKNILGIETSAKNEADITPDQVEKQAQWIVKNFPEPPVYGHGSIVTNREEDEGSRVATRVRELRAEAAANIQSGTTPFGPPGKRIGGDVSNAPISSSPTMREAKTVPGGGDVDSSLFSPAATKLPTTKAPDLGVKGGGPRVEDHQNEITRLKNEKEEVKRSARETRHQEQRQNRHQQNQQRQPINRPKKMVGDPHLAMLTVGNA